MKNSVRVLRAMYSPNIHKDPRLLSNYTSGIFKRNQISIQLSPSQPDRLAVEDITRIPLKVPQLHIPQAKLPNHVLARIALLIPSIIMSPHIRAPANRSQMRITRWASGWIIEASSAAMVASEELAFRCADWMFLCTVSIVSWTKLSY